MKISRTRTAILALLCGTPLLQADILELKNGTKVEGTILEQNDQGVKMKYRLTPKIMDEKIFPAADIAKVIKQTPQEVDLIELRKLLPTPDLMKADAYEQIIQDKLRPFVNKYPGTPEAKEGEDMITKLQEEKTLVTNGQTKLAGKWLSVKEAKAEQFNIEAFQIIASMRDKAAKLDYVGAMREFDRLTTPPPAYKGSTQYVEAIPQAAQILEKWITVLGKMESEQPLMERTRQEGLAKLQEPDLTRTKTAINEEIEKWRQTYENDRRSKARWLTAYKYDLASIQNVKKDAEKELARLRAYNLDELKAQNEIFTDSYRKIGEDDYMGGAAAYQRIQAMNLSQEFRDVPTDIYARLLKLHAKLSKATASGSATSGSSAIGGTNATGVDSRVAQILAESNGTPAPATAAPGAAMPATGAAPAAITAPAPAPAATAPAPAPAAAAPRPVAPAPVAPQPAYQQPAPQAPMPVMPVEEESNTSLYIMIGMGVVIVGLLLAFMKKK